MGSLPSERRLNVKHIAVIGAGPSGLAAAKYLVAEQAFSSVTIFEQRSVVGGLWNHVSEKDIDLEHFTVPQTSPLAGPEKPRWQTSVDGEPTPLFQSAIYDRLETNIPRSLMGFSDLSWPHKCQLFPGHREVLDYLRMYAKDVKHLIRFQEQVLDVRLSTDDRWLVKTQSLAPDRDRTVQEQSFDAVVVANGHFNVPFLPSVPGIEAWEQHFPGTIVHSRNYRKPENYSGKKVIVVGNSASGTDIAAQIATVSQNPVLQSQKSESMFGPSTSSTILPKPEIAQYNFKERIVRFVDGSVEKNVDAVVYCTGYLYSYPFLDSVDPPLVSTGQHVANTYQHLFYRPQPTLAFLVLNQAVIPFQVAEVQSAVIARVWSGRLALPNDSEMKSWEDKLSNEIDRERAFHVCKFPKDADYINMLHEWAKSADGEASTKDGTEPKKSPSKSGQANVGKEPPYWGEKEYWTRERFPAIKKAFASFGEDRHAKRTLEDVGFDFGAWKREQKSLYASPV